MTTQLVNVAFSKEIHSFKKVKPEVTPLHLAYALADLISADKKNAMQSLPVAALLHALNKAVHGEEYKIDGKKEQARLESALQ